MNDRGEIYSRVFKRSFNWLILNPNPAIIASFSFSRMEEDIELNAFESILNRIDFTSATAEAVLGALVTKAPSPRNSPGPIEPNFRLPDF